MSVRYKSDDWLSECDCEGLRLLRSLVVYEGRGRMGCQH